MTEDTTPEPDRIDGAPHPRETAQLFGQSKAEKDFLDAFASGRLHSGWLITGPRGVGKATLAWKIATFLLSSPDAGLFGEPSLHVDPDHPDARLVQAGAHPRLSLIRRPWDDKTKKLRAEITVDAVRNLKTFFHMSAADGGHRVVIVDAADELNRNAANAILKELEEPPANTTILLIAHQPSRLLPTIRSRCRELRCATLSPHDLQKALDQAGHPADSSDALATLAGGSAGDAIRMLNHDGMQLYNELIRTFDGLPHINRPAALKLADSCAGRGADVRFGMTLDLIDFFLSRVARAGLMGEPSTQAAPGEARLLTRLSPHDRAAQRWAQLQQDLSERSRRGRAVNLDPAALILDIIFKIEETAQGVAAA
ncbi:DNA polymerase III subunit delta' [Yoonia sediminilitoris]|uniref:DNA polymerase III delta prime subunit n=1 Tax=Yoonia sediminilitoris TaxID=1286148 RepID=A0A2T6KC37_9RHOB|nr:DNA polymerase III subunit delta' [Yoonia sediminilitoris]PUB12477.1 DNA polymerase III delta prime subunit [Yoonia sediminilitoris]RCW93171.1 DNA polymerase III delta prime subunit [Yoonia sediminilitoris]